MSLSRLHLAIEQRDKIGVETLLQENVDANCVYCQETALTKAINLQADDIVHTILGHPNCSVNACNQFDRSPLYCSSLLGKVGLTKLLLERGSDVNKTDVGGVTPLGATTWYDRGETASCLLQFGASVDFASKRGETPLFKACSFLSINVVKVLIDNGSDVNSKTCEGKTPLMATVLANDNDSSYGSRKIEIMSLLLEHGADLDIQDNKLNSSLHYAVEDRNVYVACFLMERGCKLHILNNENLSPFDIAISKGKQLFNVAVLFWLYGFHLPNLDTKVLRCVLYKDKYQEIDENSRKTFLSILLDETMDTCKVKSVYAETITYLKNNIDEHEIDQSCLAILKRYSEIKTSLISLQHICCQTVRRNLRENLFLSLKQLNIPRDLRKLLSFGIDTSFSPLDVYNLFSSIERGSKSDLQRYIDSGINKDFILCDMTPLMAAAKFNNIGAVSYLLSIKTNCHYQNSHGECALHVAAKLGHIEIVKLLSNCNICTIKVNDNGNKAFQEALVHGHVDCALSLLDSCSNSEIDRPDLNGIPQLHYAVGNKSFELTSGLLKKGASINALDANGNSALHVAVTKGTIYLKENKNLGALFDSNVSSALYMTSIMTCDVSEISNKCGSLFKFDSHKQILDLLLEAGCDVNIINNHGKKALDLSLEFGFSDTFSLLTLRS